MNVFDNLSTLTLLGGLVTLVIVLMTVAQGVFAFAYARLLWMAAPAKTDDSGELPKAAVVLSLRGADPYLTTCIQAVLEQDYPDFTLFIVVDSPQDSAWEDVHQIQSRTQPGRIVSTALANRLTTCSLKCCALAEVVENLDPSYAVVAFLDGDGAPHRHWLRDLVVALRDESVGVSTGNRWYTPDQVTWGAMVRYFWNAGAIVQVWLNGIIWAGSMALRRETIREIDLINAWRKSLSVDGAVVRQTQAHGYKARFVPTVILPNREDITVSSFVPWSERQLVAAKSSGSGWSVVLLHALTLVLCVFGPMVMLVAGLYLPSATLVGQALVAMLAFWGGAMLFTLAIEQGMQRVLASNRVPADWMNIRAGFYFLPAVILSHLVYFRTLIGAHFRKRVKWRGVEYKIDGVNDVQMIGYQPYERPIASRDIQSVV